MGLGVEEEAGELPGLGEWWARLEVGERWVRGERRGKNEPPARGEGTGELKLIRLCLRCCGNRSGEGLSPCSEQ